MRKIILGFSGGFLNWDQPRDTILVLKSLPGFGGQYPIPICANPELLTHKSVSVISVCIGKSTSVDVPIVRVCHIRSGYNFCHNVHCTYRSSDY